MPHEQECSARIARLQAELQRVELDGALFLYPVDIYYYCATRQNAILWVPAAGKPLLLVRKGFERAKAEAGLGDVRPFPRSKDFAQLFAGRKRIGLTYDVVPLQQYDYYRQLLPNCEFADISMINRELRSVKSEWELERMRHGGVQLSRAFAMIPDLLQPGMREVDLAAELEAALRRIGGEGLIRMRAFNQEMFMGIVSAGASGSRGGFFDGAVTGQGMSRAVPCGASTRLIAPGEPVLIDYAGVFDGYHLDMTRMFVCGELNEQLQNAFYVSCRIQDQIAAKLKPGAICSELFAESAALAVEAGLGDFYMGPPGEQARFVGHGIGLELDEFPVLAQGFDMPLLAGQTLAVEPKFVFPELGPIGIENTYVVSAQGGEKITVLSDKLIAV